MKLEDFKLGQVVSLKSGGITMTVNGINPEGTNNLDGTVRVVFGHRETVEYAAFRPELLMISGATETGGRIVPVPKWVGREWWG